MMIVLFHFSNDSNGYQKTHFTFPCLASFFCSSRCDIFRSIGYGWGSILCAIPHIVHYISSGFNSCIHSMFTTINNGTRCFTGTIANRCSQIFSTCVDKLSVVFKVFKSKRKSSSNYSRLWLFTPFSMIQRSKFWYTSEFFLRRRRERAWVWLKNGWKCHWNDAYLPMLVRFFQHRRQQHSSLLVLHLWRPFWYHRKHSMPNFSFHRPHWRQHFVCHQPNRRPCFSFRPIHYVQPRMFYRLHHVPNDQLYQLLYWLHFCHLQQPFPSCRALCVQCLMQDSLFLKFQKLKVMVNKIARIQFGCSLGVSNFHFRHLTFIPFHSVWFCFAWFHAEKMRSL